MILKELKSIYSEIELEKFLQRYADVSLLRFKRGNTFLHLVVYSGNLNALKLALRRSKIRPLLDIKNEAGENPLDLAYRLGFQDIYSWLKFDKGDINLIEAPDHWAEYFKNLKKAKINTKSNWTTYRGTEVRLKRRVEHDRGSALKQSHMLAEELNLKYEFKIPKFLLTPVRWYHRVLNWLGVIFTNNTKEYPWKSFKPEAKHSFVDCYYTKMSSEIGRKLKQKAKSLETTPVALFCAIADKVFQEEFLTKPVVSDNLLTLNFTSVPEPRHSYHTEVSVLPFTAKGESTIPAKAKGIASKLKWGIFFKTYLRVDNEVKLFNYFFKRKPQLIEPFLAGRRSRFVTYSYFGDFKVTPEVYEHDFIGLGRSTPMMKISLAFHFKNDDLVVSLDINSQILERRSDHNRILEQLRKEIEEFVQSP